LRISPSIEQSFAPEFSLPTAFNETVIPLGAVDRSMGGVFKVIAQSSSRYASTDHVKTFTGKARYGSE
jgi:hypothetical protein